MESAGGAVLLGRREERQGEDRGDKDASEHREGLVLGVDRSVLNVGLRETDDQLLLVGLESHCPLLGGLYTCPRRGPPCSVVAALSASPFTILTGRRSSVNGAGNSTGEPRASGRLRQRTGLYSSAQPGGRVRPSSNVFACQRCGPYSVHRHRGIPAVGCCTRSRAWQLCACRWRGWRETTRITVSSPES